MSLTTQPVDQHDPALLHDGDEITTINCQSSNKKISSRYTQLRKQLRSCEHFKENYFVLEVNKPSNSKSNGSADDNSQQQLKKKRKKNTIDQLHPDESLSNDDGSAEEMKKKRKKNNSQLQPSSTSSLPITTSTTTSVNTTTVSNNNSNQNTTTDNNNNGLVLQLIGCLLQNNNSTTNTCTTQPFSTTNANMQHNPTTVSLEELELKVKLLQRLQETINLLKGSPIASNPSTSTTQDDIFNNHNNNYYFSTQNADVQFQQIMDFGDCWNDENSNMLANTTSLPTTIEQFSDNINLAGASVSCEDFVGLLNSFDL